MVSIGGAYFSKPQAEAVFQDTMQFGGRVYVCDQHSMLVYERLSGSVRETFSVAHVGLAMAGQLAIPMMGRTSWTESF